jgi:hypothetical protein
MNMATPVLPVNAHKRENLGMQVGKKHPASLIRLADQLSGPAEVAA